MPRNRRLCRTSRERDVLTAIKPLSCERAHAAPRIMNDGNRKPEKPLNPDSRQRAFDGKESAGVCRKERYPCSGDAENDRRDRNLKESYACLEAELVRLCERL